MLENQSAQPLGPTTGCYSYVSVYFSEEKTDDFVRKTDSGFGTWITKEHGQNIETTKFMLSVYECTKVYPDR